MTFRLLALVIALLLVATLPLVRHWRDLRWFEWWTARCEGTRGAGRVWLALAPPAVLAAIVGLIFSSADWLAVIWLAFAILVLIYTLGPRYLEADIDAVLGAENREQASVAAQALRVHADDDAALPLTPSALVEATVLSALKRRFGVVFWFLLLGPGGAVLYRLAQRLGGHADTDAERRGAARRFAEGMDWPASHLMVFAMALVSDFDAVIGAWREWHRAPTRSPWTFEPGFLGTVARAGVDADVAAGDEGENDTGNPVIELTDTRRLLLRVLLVWLAVMAVLVLLSWAI